MDDARDEGPTIRHISDTARWMAVFRARETARPDAAFRDPFASALAGEWGERDEDTASARDADAWPFIARTYLFDRFVTRLVAHGVDLIVNLAAGLDTRPYRMALPASLRWVEVDLPDILDYKEEVLADAAPACALERVRLDLTNEDARRGLFARLARGAQRAAILSEGLVVYLMPGEVGALARDLASPPAFQHWVVDIASPRALDQMKERLGDVMTEAGLPFLFAPAEGPSFFAAHGWDPSEARSLIKAAGKLGRLPLALRMLALLPEPSGPPGDRPWSAVCHLTRQAGPSGS
jgi:methyltransferase (TIGR00027 family)